MSWLGKLELLYRHCPHRVRTRRLDMLRCERGRAFPEVIRMTFLELA
jgi:hypothetical protein